MIDFLIRFNDGQTVESKGWADRPIQSLILCLHRTFDDIRDIEIIGFSAA